MSHSHRLTPAHLTRPISISNVEEETLAELSLGDSIHAIGHYAGSRHRSDDSGPMPFIRAVTFESEDDESDDEDNTSSDVAESVEGTPVQSSPGFQSPASSGWQPNSPWSEISMELVENDDLFSGAGDFSLSSDQDDGEAPQVVGQDLIESADSVTDSDSELVMIGSVKKRKRSVSVDQLEGASGQGTLDQREAKRSRTSGAEDD